jgi:hypothetical protein
MRTPQGSLKDMNFLPCLELYNHQNYFAFMIVSISALLNCALNSP